VITRRQALAVAVAVRQLPLPAPWPPGRLGPSACRCTPTALPTAQVTVPKGCHDGVFWQHQAPAELRFLSAALDRGGSRG
jgi:hypothetical protein